MAVFFLPTYGVLVALGFLAALWITVRLAKAAELLAEAVTNLAIYCALAGLAGAKLFMFLFNFRDYWNDPEIDLHAEHAAGGGSVTRAGFCWRWWWRSCICARCTCRCFETFDVFAPGIALGHAIGRLGCLAAGCCWGTECHLPWAITFSNPEANQLTGVPLNVPLHPTQLYESLAEVLDLRCFCFGGFASRTRRARSSGLYLILYSSVRFLVEFVRNHEQAMSLGFR